MRRAMAEFTGTALMVGVGCGSVAYGASNLVISLSFGIAVTVAILIFQSFLRGKLIRIRYFNLYSKPATTTHNI